MNTFPNTARGQLILNTAHSQNVNVYVCMSVCVCVCMYVCVRHRNHHFQISSFDALPACG